MDYFLGIGKQTGRTLNLLGIVIAVTLFAFPYAALATPDPDSQWWGELDLSHPLSPDVSFTASGYIRAGDGYPNPWLTGIGAAVDYRVSPFTFTGGDLLVGVRTLSGQTLNVQLPYISGTYSLQLNNFSLSDRVRAEQLSGVPGSPRRYRDRLGMNIPVASRFELETDFTASQEWFLNSAHRLTRTRTMVAVGFALSRRTSFQLQFIRQRNTSGVPSALNILGTELGVTF